MTPLMNSAFDAPSVPERPVVDRKGKEPASVAPAVPPLGHRESLYPSATESPFKLPVFAPPGVKRTAFAEEPETTVIALGGAPGKAYEPDGWEL